jgi:hypothetical protein
MSLWSSASAVADVPAEPWAVDRLALPLFTVAVQLGFVVGAAASAVANLRDRGPDPRSPGIRRHNLDCWRPDTGERVGRRPALEKP